MTIAAPVAGLVHRQAAVASEASYRGVVNAGIISVDWKAIQPKKAGPLVTTSIDTALDEAEALDQQVKLKVFCGRGSPLWAINTGRGGPCLYDPPSTEDCYKVPCWWESYMVTYYDDLMAKLAAKYDANPHVSTVQASMTGVLFAEPFLRVAALQQNVNRLVSKGFTAAKDEAAIRTMINIHATRWPNTRCDLACHPYQRIDAGLRRYVGADQGFTRSIMEYARDVLGDRAQFGYTALGKVPESGSAEEELFADFAAVGAPLWMQTATFEKLGGTKAGMLAALQEGIDMGAQSIELPHGYTAATPNELAPYDEALTSNSV